MNPTSRSRTPLTLAAAGFLLMPLTSPRGVTAGQAQDTAPREARGEIVTDALRPRRGAAARRLESVTASQHAVRLAPLPRNAGAAAADSDGPHSIGRGRAVPDHQRRAFGGDLGWTDVDGGRATTISVSSPGARALRVALVAEQLPPGAEISFFPAGAAAAGFGPYGRDRLVRAANGNATGGATRARFERFWSPVVSGDTIDVELWLPAAASVEALRLWLPAVSHLHTDPGTATRDLGHLGRASACEVDLACDPKWQTAADSVAKMVFTTFAGGTSVCTGQLLADTDGSHTLDYFLTASHCIALQSHADTIDFYWFFQRAACSGPDPAAVVQTTGGAQVLLTKARGNSTDQTLLLLNEPAPIGATRTGWSTREPDKEDDVVAGIHHPGGDVKKLSIGIVKLLAKESTQDFASHVWVEFSSGVTEPGSSGSGIWFDGQWPDQFLIGTLTGGSSSCAVPDGIDMYGRFDQLYLSVKAWLEPGTAPQIASGAEVRDNVEQGDWKIYRLRPGSAAADVDAIARDITGNVDLYLLSTLAPAGTLFDCASRNPGNATEECSVTRSPGTTFIGILGAGDGRSDYTLVANATDAPLKKPTKPKLQKAKRLSAGRVRVTWKDKSKDETGFLLERRIRNGKWASIATLPANARRTVDSGLEPGVRTCYRVRAFNVVGASGASNKRCVTP